MADKSSATAGEWALEPVLDWVFAEGRQLRSNNQFVKQLACQLLAAGAPLDRLMVGIRVLHPLLVGISETWLRSTGETRHIETVRGIRLSDRYIGSPMQAIYEGQKPVQQRLDNLPDDAHRAYTELAEMGHIDYLGIPVFIGDEPGAALIFSTCRDSGFDEHDLRQFRKLANYLAPLFEAHKLRRLSRTLMDTYVGKRTGEKVLSGMIQRGDADVINAALWFSDLRNFTRLTETLPAQQLLQMLNEYFEFVSAAVTARGGEILRFIGDAMLIVFPINEGMCQKTACNAALEAALDAHDTLATLNHRRRRHGQPEIQFGVGLNVGEVIYGNVGAPDRLDFTVMGPAVNLSARLESLTKSLDSDILYSGSFAAMIDAPSRDLGVHEMKGVAEAQAVFAPSAD